MNQIRKIRQGDEKANKVRDDSNDKVMQQIPEKTAYQTQLEKKTGE